MGITDFLGQRSAAQNEHDNRQHERLKADEIDSCPHCGARVSAIDQKMNHCFSCSRSILVSSEGREESDSRSFTVGL